MVLMVSESVELALVDKFICRVFVSGEKEISEIWEFEGDVAARGRLIWEKVFCTMVQGNFKEITTAVRDFYELTVRLR